MDDDRPELIAIEHDDYAAKYVGRTEDGRQFILTTPFEPAMNGPGAEFLALYLFDDEGKLLDAKIENLGPRATMDEERRVQLRDQWLAELGEVSYERVEVAPFSVKKFGTEFGLIVREPEDEEDVLAVEMQPGNYMAFFEPWTPATTTRDGGPASRITSHCNGPAGRNGPCDSNAARCPAGR